MTIGIIDSGLGGYSIFHALHQAYPNAAFHFLADQDDREGPALGRELVLFARHGNTSQK